MTWEVVILTWVASVVNETRSIIKGADMRIAIGVLVSLVLVGTPIFTQTAEIVKTNDGLLVATLPSGWMQTKGKNFLMIQNEADTAYATLSAEDRRDYYGLNLEKYAFLQAYQFVKDMTFVTVSGPKKLTISGKQAIQYDIAGVSGTLKINYIITCIEATNTFQSIVAWSSASFFEKVRGELETIPKIAQEGSLK